MIIAMYFLMVSDLFNRQLIDGIGTYQVLVLNHERLVTTPVLLVEFHHEALVVGMVNFAIVNTVRSLFLPGTSVA